MQLIIKKEHFCSFFDCVYEHDFVALFDVLHFPPQALALEALLLDAFAEFAFELSAFAPQAFEDEFIALFVLLLPLDMPFAFAEPLLTFDKFSVFAFVVFLCFPNILTPLCSDSTILLCAKFDRKFIF
jgi:hypothetical protein